MRQSVVSAASDRRALTDPALHPISRRASWRAFFFAPIAVHSLNGWHFLVFLTLFSGIHSLSVLPSDQCFALEEEKSNQNSNSQIRVSHSCRNLR